MAVGPDVEHGNSELQKFSSFITSPKACNYQQCSEIRQRNEILSFFQDKSKKSCYFSAQTIFMDVLYYQ